MPILEVQFVGGGPVDGQVRAVFGDPDPQPYYTILVMPSIAAKWRTADEPLPPIDDSYIRVEKHRYRWNGGRCYVYEGQDGINRG